MNDQYMFTDDTLGWGDWLLPGEAQPFWATGGGKGGGGGGFQYIQETAPPDTNQFNWAMSDPSEVPPDIQNFTEPPGPLDQGSGDFHAGKEADHDNVNHGINPFNRFSQRFVYPKTTCASCNAPLDLSEQQLGIENPNIYCTGERSPNHPPLSCNDKICGQKFGSFKKLKQHWQNSFNHFSFQCAVLECSAPLGIWDLRSHWNERHQDTLYHCAQCKEGFKTQELLNRHGLEATHAAYRCQYPECTSEFAKPGDLGRHQLIHKSDVPRHPCPHCRKYRGKKGFIRKDHLRQHIRNYHHIEDNATDSNQGDQVIFPCTFPNCDRIDMNSFMGSKELKAHLKKDHPSPFQCIQYSCDRVGTKGWFRERDMVKHVKKVHGIEL